MRYRRILSLAACLACAIPCAQASTTYTYVGQNFTSLDTGGIPWGSTSQDLTGYFTVAAPLGPNFSGDLTSVGLLDWSLTDGVNTITSSTPNSGFGFDSFTTDSGGNIDSWAWDPYHFTTPDLEIIFDTSGSLPPLTTSGLDFTTIYGYDTTSSLWVEDGGAFGFVPGTWEEVPEPNSLALGAAGLLVLAAARLRRRRTL